MAVPERKVMSRKAARLSLAGVCTMVLGVVFSYSQDYSEELFHIDCCTKEEFISFLRPHERFLYTFVGGDGVALCYDSALLCALFLCVLAWWRVFRN